MKTTVSRRTRYVLLLTQANKKTSDWLVRNIQDSYALGGAHPLAVLACLVTLADRMQMRHLPHRARVRAVRKAIIGK